MADSPLMTDSPRSNGCLVRFIGRRRIRDGSLERVVMGLKAVLAPWLLLDLLRARRARRSWAECLLQLYSLGHPACAGALPRPLSARSGSVRFVCISDTHMQHGKLPPLPPGDILVHCGDFTNFGSLAEVKQFARWFGQQPHAVKIAVPGNHDMIMDEGYYDDYWGDWSSRKESHREAVVEFTSRGVRLLVDASMEVLDLRVHGSPWVPRYAPWQTAFNREVTAMEEVWRAVPTAVDVLLTHTPPRGRGDLEEGGRRAGCPYLARRVAELRPKLHVFGHVHSDYGLFPPGPDGADCTTSVNAACVSGGYFVGGRGAIAVDVPRSDG
uniref:Calcineurin-like phosphoesterase domain-containing protein n=1 Tax=Alexandrium monilatum TaxID=311494 RepID=A0A7S4SJT9_9DINO